MRALLISVLALGLCIVVWCIFYEYSNHELHQLITSCENEVLTAIQIEDWEKAYDSFSNQYEQWHHYQNFAMYMLDTDKITAIDEAYAKTLMYIKEKDASNSSGELLALKESLKAVHHSEAIALNNIF